MFYNISFTRKKSKPCFQIKLLLTCGNLSFSEKKCFLFFSNFKLWICSNSIQNTDTICISKYKKYPNRRKKQVCRKYTIFATNFMGPFYLSPSSLTSRRLIRYDVTVALRIQFYTTGICTNIIQYTKPLFKRCCPHSSKVCVEIR